MTRSEEIRHRWDRIKEAVTLDAIIKRMRQTVTDEQILYDIQFLRDRVVELERNLGDALNPVSSSWGVLTDVKDGILYYRINGKFMPMDEVIEAIQLLEAKKAKKKGKSDERPTDSDK